jgi:Arc/MetJ family transcription regulator
MKMTMHIDEELLDRVVERFGFASKTEAVDSALREIERRARFKEVAAAGLGATPEEMKAAVEPGYDVLALRAAEGATPYGKPAASKRRR